MDEHDEHEPETLFPTEPVTERVRIVGAETAGTLAGENQPAGPRADETLSGAPSSDAASADEPFSGETVSGGTFAGGALSGAHLSGNGLDEPEPWAADEPPLVAPELPHWTDPPTGQVPAVLDRRGDDDDTWGTADTGPVWREHQHEWEDDTFEPALLADEWTRVGALEETPLEERRPWEFDDLSGAAAGEGTSTPMGGGLDDAGAASGLDPEARHGDAPPVAGSGASWWEEGAEDPDDDMAPPATEIATPPATLSSAGIPPAVVEESVAPGPELTTPAFTPAEAAPAAVAPVAGAPAAVARPRAAAPLRVRPPDRGRTPPRVPPAPPARNVPLSVATGLGLAAVALGCFAAGTVATLVLVTVVVALAAAECFAALRRAGLRPATLLGLVATVAVVVSAYAKGPTALPLVLVLVVVTSMIWYLVGAERGSPLQGISATVLGFAWVGLLGSYAGLLLAPSVYPTRHGIAFLLGAVVATVGEDVGALAVGSWLGRHQLAPHISPNKTWEGTIGGAVLAVVLSAAVTGQVHPWTPTKAAILGVVVAVIAPIGDLCESLIKRDLGLKDMGSLLPGHGGVLDRVDALLFVLPATYYLVRVLNLG